MNPEKIIARLCSETIDTVSGLSLADLPIKPLISIEQNQLHLNLITGFPSRFLEEALHANLTSSLHHQLPGYEINMTFDPFIKAHRTQMPGKGLQGVKNVIAIASGKGGVGKSTVAVNLAAALAEAGARVGILDADIYGPSIPLMLGDVSPVQIDHDKYKPILAHGVQAMSIGYLAKGESALIWRGPMLAKSLLQMINITQWDELDYLFIDLPPGTGDIQLSLVQKVPLTAAVIVTTPQTVATLDAQKALHMFQKTNIEVLGIIENMSLHQCTQCGHQEAIFGEGGAQTLAKTHQCTLLGQLPLSHQITQDSDRGIPSALSPDRSISNPFKATAMKMAIELAKKPLNYADKFPPIRVETEKKL